MKIKQWYFLVLASVVLTGCAHYQWQQSGKDEETRKQDSYACEKEAAQLYPVILARQFIDDGFYSEPFTRCTTLANKTTCTTTPGFWHRPITALKDVNEDNRDRAFRKCMEARGWTWQKMDDPR